MDDIASKITELLNDPQGMENIKNMAQSILSENNINLPSEQPAQSNDIDPAQLAGIVKVLKTFNSNNKDDRTNLLLALRPHLSPPRQEKLDRAIKLMKLYSMLPLIQQSGLFNL
ncbi:MAG: hypothetical protein UHN02_01240 [Acutalibacteraceae bacterium]|nr:hypothetical protein [Acutalibacteraceae bacterium]